MTSPTEVLQARPGLQLPDGDGPRLLTLTRETFTGPWAGLPVAWTDGDQFDETVYRADIARCCEADVPGVYTGGTTGEFYALEFDEFKAITRATIDECHARGKPAMIGCSSTYTLGAARRAEFAAALGADAIQLALPFWMEIGDRQIVPFFKEVIDAAGGLPLSVYETTRAKKALNLDQHHAIKDAVPSYLVVKANDGTIGRSPQGCQALSRIVNVFAGENMFGELGRVGLKGSCSSVIYWNPRLILSMWRQVERQEWEIVDFLCLKINRLFDFLGKTFGPQGFTDTANDRMGGVAGGFLKCSLRSRGPYPSATLGDVENLRRWYREHFPEMLSL